MNIDIEEFMRAKYHIGQPLFEQGKIFPEGMYYRCQDLDHLVLFIMPDSFSMSDRSLFSYEEAEFTVVMREGIIFLMIRFEEAGWHRAHFLWHFVPEEQRNHPKDLEQPDGTSVMHLLLIDKIVGCVQGIRKVVIPPEFTQELHKLIEEQSQKPAMPVEEYYDRVHKAEHAYPRPADMAKESKVRFLQTPSRPAWYTPVRNATNPIEQPLA